MYKYKVNGLVMESDVDFPQLISAKEDVLADFSLKEGDLPDYIINRDDNKKYEIGKEESWLINSCLYYKVEGGKSITYKMKPEGDYMKMRSYILGFAISMLALQRGKLAIHCSVVCKNGKATLIAGESGAGKSTLTDRLLENGYKLMADDMTFVEVVDGNAVAHSAFPYRKLCKNVVEEKSYDKSKLIYIDEDKEKYLVPCHDKFVSEPLKVEKFVYLTVNKGEKVEFSKIEGINKFIMISNNLFLRHLLKQQKFEPWIGELSLKLASVLDISVASRPVLGDSTKEISEKYF